MANQVISNTLSGPAAAASFAFPLVLFPPLINLNEVLVLRQF
jgi:hypothetical protein